MGKSWYDIKAKSANEADVFIYNEIGYFGITADRFVKDLEDIQADTINLRINTPGGVVTEGMAIYNALVRHKARIITHIDGLAASMGSIIALAGDEVNIAENAFFMIHNPSAVVWGDSKDMRKTADTLDKMRNSLVKTYAAKSGKDEDEIKQLMDDETWFTADEAKDAGFVDNITGKKTEKAHFDLSVYNKVPQKLIAMTGELPSEREIERALREAGGLSRAAAKAVLSKGYKGLAQRDAEAGNQRDADDDTNLKEKSTMDIQELKAKHSAIYDAVRKEGFEAGKTEAARASVACPDCGKELKCPDCDSSTDAQEKGAKAERERIQGVFSLNKTGREKIVSELMFDGKSTKAEAAERILAADDEKKANLLKDLKADAGDIKVSQAEPGDQSATEDKTLPAEDRAKAHWDKSPELRAEFRDNFNAYVAYIKNVEAGNARILNKGGR